MNIFKRFIAVFLALACLTLFAACKKEVSKQSEPVRSDEGITIEEDDTPVIRINYSEKLIVLYEMFTLKIMGTDETPVWKSSDESIVTVTENGVIYGASVGNAVVTATVGENDYSCNVSVSGSGKLPVIRVDLVYDRVELDPGSAYTLTPVIYYNDSVYTDATFTFTGFDTSVVSVSDKGVVTAKSVGTTEVTINAQWRSVAEIIEVIVPIDVK